MSSGSDTEMQSALPKKSKKKTLKSPTVEMLKNQQEQKKISTREMITDALSALNTRKGISLYAIKKYITEKHNVNVDKINYIIKKNIKAGVEDGTIVQTKGVGASGSFKLAPKKKPDPSEKPKPKKKVLKPKKTEDMDKAKKAKKLEKAEKPEKKMSKKVDTKTEKTTKNTEEKKRENKEKRSKNNMAKEKQTPAKKRAAMMKRKSIGSIIKPPKMKPKARA